MELQSLRSTNSSTPTGTLEWSSSPPSGAGVASIEGAIAPPPSSNPVNAQPAAAPASSGGISSLFSSPFASAGVQYGRSLLQENSFFNRGLGGWLRASRLRYYFLVDQKSVLSKSARVLFPFVSYDWARKQLDDVDPSLVAATGASNPSAAYQSPSKDINAPDLYLGLMAFVTFVVTSGYALGFMDESVTSTQEGAQIGSVSVIVPRAVIPHISTDLFDF